MNYRETIGFLFSSLPIYQREGKAAYKANLDNTHRLDKYFGHPHREFPVIHVAGTNGKGSVSHMLASVFTSAGYKTGLYTSPHLLDFRERIRINGKKVPEKMVIRFVDMNQEIIKEISPSFFEMTVAMAFDYFAREGVDIAIIETGMGGRLDSTNIAQPILSVITNISMDHSQFLGSTPGAIAREKGGIIKESVPLVLGETGKESKNVLLRMAEDKNAPVTLAPETFRAVFQTYNSDGTANFTQRNMAEDHMESYESDLAGHYQQENLSTVLSSIMLLREQGWKLPETALKEGLRSVCGTTGIMGRWQTVGANPRSICDTAHNSAGIRAVMDQVKKTPWKNLHIVWGMVSDKDTGSILPLLPDDASYYFTPSTVPRTLDAEKLRQEAATYGKKGDAFTSVHQAYRAARENAGADDMIFTGGSTFIVADLLESLGY
ncbi:MAG: bifunctional folylpolyglutamate synthase/dihydrofolate synthase [Bacteroidetes bacterium]|nr:bifunctional folylpolyglutamate synthase/dihydrofolate synthase [Bacteroidota bacterium]